MLGYAKHVQMTSALIDYFGDLPLLDTSDRAKND